MTRRPDKAPPRRSRPVQLAETIKEWVVEHELRAGDRLPGEAELIARYGRSKGTVREAMRILEAQGLVETRTGPGFTICCDGHLKISRFWLLADERYG